MSKIAPRPAADSVEPVDLHAGANAAAPLTLSHPTPSSPQTDVTLANSALPIRQDVTHGVPPSPREPQSGRSVAILGIRGVPAAHGGFETFAERLAPWLVERGWTVTVYCQAGPDEVEREDEWQGVRRVHIPAPDTHVGSMIFDWKSIVHFTRHNPRGLSLMLGYNTAVFAARLRLARCRTVINMDGIEWARGKWGRMARTWFWLNDWAGCWLGTRLIADHPEIGKLLSTRTRSGKISVIPYGADRIEPTEVSPGPLQKLGLQPRRYATLIARPEPENSIIEVVEAWSAQHRGVPLVVLGRYEPQRNAYHARVIESAGNEVRFVGAIYDEEIVRCLRAHSLFYVHGHQVGGTNPSLVEALGSGNPVLAHDNPFNRWVARDAAQYFGSVGECSDRIGSLLGDPAHLVRMQSAARARHASAFEWPMVLSAYEQMLLQQVAIIQGDTTVMKRSEA